MLSGEASTARCLYDMVWTLHHQRDKRAEGFATRWSIHADQ
jgi:hypothetical protein